jgi:hypothetical protein
MLFFDTLFLVRYCLVAGRVSLDLQELSVNSMSKILGLVLINRYRFPESEL